MRRPTVHAPSGSAQALDMLNVFLDSRLAEGAEFKTGHLVQCAWMWFMVGDHEGKLAILSPRLGAMPMEFVPDCSDALNLVLKQRYICDSFTIECGWCNARQSALVVKDIAECKDIFMNRIGDEDGSSSGWFFGAGDTKLEANDPANLELRSLWELSCEFPVSRDFFLLPTGWQVVFEARPTVLNDFEPVPPQPGSCYEAQYGS